jgi:hypothetical protein
VGAAAGAVHAASASVTIMLKTTSSLLKRCMTNSPPVKIVTCKVIELSVNGEIAASPKHHA